MSRCSVLNCGGPHTHLFKVPNMLQDLWCENLKIPASSLKFSTRICNRHFEPTCMIAPNKLKPGAIPTLFLGHCDTSLHQSTYRTLKPVIRKRMCHVNGCKITDPPNKLYSFPRDTDKRAEWVNVCNVKPAHLALKNMYICANHFRTDMIAKDRLRDNAFPTRFVGLDANLFGSSAVKVTVCENCVDRFQLEQEFQAYKLKNTERVTFLNRQIASLEEQLKSSREQKVELFKNSIEIEKGISNNAVAFARTICNPKNKKYTEEQKSLLLNLNYVSTKAFKYMRESLKFALPSNSTLYRWSPVKSLNPGINNEVIHFMTSMAASMAPIERHAVLIMDEISGRHELEYNIRLDRIDGFEDYGNGERTPNVAGKFNFFMVKGLYKSWKTPFSYYATKNAISGTVLKELVINTIKAISLCGINVQCIVCDQGPNNEFCIRQLRANPTDNFFIDDEGKKIYIFYDFPHLVKGIRNALLSSDIGTEDGVASWEVLKELYHTELESDSVRLAPKLTLNHVYPNNFNKMRVPLAAQVFSKTTANAIQTLVSLNKFIDPDNIANAISTADFCENMNFGFDCLNGKVFGHKNPDKTPICLKNNQLVKLNSFKQFLQSLVLPKNSRVVSIKNTIKSIETLEEMAIQILNQHEDGVCYLPPGRINQDCLENFFALIRSRLGNSVNPSLRDIQYLTARLLSMRIITKGFISNKNCEDDDDTDWDFQPTNQPVCQDLGAAAVLDALECEEHGVNENIDVDFSLNEMGIDENLTEDDTVEENVSPTVAACRYFVGYGINKKLNCQKCEIEIVKLDNLALKSESFISLKNFTERLLLQNPSDSFFAAALDHINVLNKVFDEKKHENDLLLKILQASTEINATKHPQFFNTEDPCYEHRMLILKHISVVLIKKKARWYLETTAKNAKTQRTEKRSKVQKAVQQKFYHLS